MKALRHLLIACASMSLGVGIAQASCTPEARSRIEAVVEDGIARDRALAYYHAFTRAQLGEVEEAIAIYDEHVLGRYITIGTLSHRAALLAQSGNEDAIGRAYQLAQDLDEMSLEEKIVIWGGEAIRRNDPGVLGELEAEIGAADLHPRAHLTAIRYFALTGMTTEAQGLIGTYPDSPQNQPVLRPLKAVLFAVQLREAPQDSIQEALEALDDPILIGMAARSIADELTKKDRFDAAEWVVRLSTRPGSIGAGLLSIAYALPPDEILRARALIEEAAAKFGDDTENHRAIKATALARAWAHVGDMEAALTSARQAVRAAASIEDDNTMKEQITQDAVVSLATAGDCIAAAAMSEAHLKGPAQRLAFAKMIAALETLDATASARGDRD